MHAVELNNIEGSSVKLFLCYLMASSVSRLRNVDDMMINEYAAVGGLTFSFILRNCKKSMYGGKFTIRMAKHIILFRICKYC
jgi:hypothetical protein